MLTILDEKIKRTPEEVESLYPHSKYILLNYGSVQNPKGNLYCVSDSDDSFKDICNQIKKFSKEGIPCLVSGSYNNGGGIGVQYEVKQ